MRVYLAGPIFNKDDPECKDWREQVKHDLSEHDILDPMDSDYRGVTDAFCSKIVEGDKALIDSCDVLLVNHTEPSVGTSMEILYAWEHKKRVVVVSQERGLSPWLLYHSETILESLDDAVNHIKELAYHTG